MKSFIYEATSGVEFNFKLPTKFEVCPRCEGRGSHVNPSIDGHGLTAEDFRDDPDFRDAYFAGVYDVTCEGCNGLRVVEEIDVDACAQSPKLKRRVLLLQHREREDSAARACELAERHAEMGCW